MGEYIRDKATGKALWQDDEGKVILKNKGGGLERVNAQAASDLILSGELTEATKEEYDARTREKEHGDTAGTLKAAAEGLGRGFFSAALAIPKLATKAGSAVLGAEDPLEDVTGQGTLENISYLAGEARGESGEKAAREYREAAQARAEVNPYASGAGELAGELAGSGGIGALGAGAARAGARVGLTRAGAIAGATEGAIYSGGAAMEDAAFHDKELTGQQLVGAMGVGAILGGGVGLVYDGSRAFLSRSRSRGATPVDSPRLAASAGAKQPEKGGLADKLRGFAEERTVKAMGARGSDLRKLGRNAEKAEATMRTMARDVLEHKLDDGTQVFKPMQAQDELAENILRARDEMGAKLGDIRQRASEFIETKAPELSPDVERIAAKARREIVEPLLASPIPEIQARAKRVAATVDSLVENLGKSQVAGLKRRAGQRGQAATLREGRKATLTELTQARIDLDNVINPAPKGPGLPPPRPEHFDELNKLRWILEDEIAAATDKAAARMGDDLARNYATVKQKYSSFVKAAQISGKAQLQDLGNRVISPSDYIAGAAGGIASGGLAAVPTAIASAAAHKAVREHSSSLLAVAADKLAKNFESKARGSVRTFFAKHPPASQTFAEQATRKPAQIGKPSVARETPRRLPKAAAAAALTLGPSMAAFMGKHDNPQKAYRERVSEVLNAANDNGETVRRSVAGSMGELANGAPTVTAHAAGTVTRAVDYLASKVPAPIRTPSALEPGKRLPVTPAEIRKFANTWNAVFNPLSVLEELEKGRLTFEGVDALRAVYPRMYERIQEQALGMIRERDIMGEPLPYAAKLKLDLLLGLQGAGEPILSPMLGQRITEIRVQTTQMNQQQLAPSVRKIPELAGSMRSGTEAAEARARSVGR